MTRLSRMLLVLLTLVSFGVAQAANTPGLLIYNVWVRPTAPTPAAGATPEAPLPGTVTGAYMTIENPTTTDYQLVSVADDFAEMSMLHQMSLDSKGVMHMNMVNSIDVPAGQTVMLASGGYHAMLMNVTHDIYAGQAVALTLTFADSSGATFAVPVGALATDEAPAAESLIVANAAAQVDALDAQAVDVALIIDNRGDQDDSLIGVTSDLTATTGLVQFVKTGISPLDTLDLPAGKQTTLAATGTVILLSQLTQPPGEAFPLTLTFKSGKSMTVAVPLPGVTS